MHPFDYQPSNLPYPNMVKLCCGKCAGLVAVSVLFHLHAVIAQPGFLSIDCGGQTNYTAPENNITWVTDVNYVDVGETAYIGDATQQAYGSSIQYLRYFPQPLNKSCYHLPVVPNVPYLLRLWFAVGNYTGFQKSSTTAFSFSIETLGMLAVQNIPTINLTNMDPFHYEEVLVSSGRVLYVCLIRTSETNDPFISAIELRRLRHGMYQQAKPGTMLNLVSRLDFCGEQWVRYPQDEFDRLWETDIFFFVSAKNEAENVAVRERISANDAPNVPPSVVMQTALIFNSTLSFGVAGRYKKSLMLLYFADLVPVNMAFSVLINGLNVSYITLTRNYSTLEKEFLINNTVPDFILLNLSTDSISNPRVILNAFELYTVVDTERATNSNDIEAVEALKMKFGIKDWISDPCYLIKWKGIGCDNSTSVVRISELNLSGRNLLGSVPENIGELTALVYLSLENNYLTGPVPNFSNLTILERLYLQNNGLNGNVPGWLSGLENLKDLYDSLQFFDYKIMLNLFFTFVVTIPGL